MLTLAVVLIASSIYGSLVNQVLYSIIQQECMQYLLDCSIIGIQSIHCFMDGKQWNEMFLYQGVSKAISRTTQQKVGLCYL